MYDARELTVEQIGAVLGVSRTSIYRALGTTTTPPPRPDRLAPSRWLRSRRWAQRRQQRCRLSFGPRPTGRRWWCARGAGRAPPRWAGLGAGRRRVRGSGRCCRSAPPTRSTPGWCGTASPGGLSCSLGRRLDRVAVRRSATPMAAGVSGLLPEPAGYAELLEQLKVRVRASRVRAARAANSELLRRSGETRR